VRRDSMTAIRALDSRRPRHPPEAIRPVYGTSFETTRARRVLRRFSAAVATSRRGDHRSRAGSLGTPQQPALRLFQGAPRLHRGCRSPIAEM
jgi:hypothetical protein